VVRKPVIAEAMAFLGEVSIDSLSRATGKVIPIPSLQLRKIPLKDGDLGESRYSKVSKRMFQK
jgi:hypothetical protein